MRWVCIALVGLALSGCISVQPGAALFVAYGSFPGVVQSSSTVKAK